MKAAAGTHQESYRQWLEDASTATIFVYSGLIVALFPAFHFVDSAIPGIPPDSLPLRLAAAAVSACVALALLLHRSLRRYAPTLQLVNILPTLMASPVLVVDSGNNHMYVAGALVLAVGLQQAFYRSRDLIVATVVACGFEVLYSAVRGVFFEQSNLEALALTGSGFFIAMVCGILRIRIQQNERELISIVDDRTRALSEANVALQETSLIDPLTGLKNRRFLMQHIENEVSLCVRRYNDWLSAGAGDAPHDADLLFFMIDIDHFKAVNDELGHGAGDRVLEQMRERLEQVFRASDYVVRWGGEEFLAVARGSCRDDAPEMAERLREAVATQPFMLDAEAPLAKTTSIGFAAFPFIPKEPQAVGWSRVVDLADRALYMAKHAGRNTWFGLASNAGTDAQSLVRQLATSASEAAHGGTLDVVSRSPQVSTLSR